MSDFRRVFDCDFTLALNNRTGKYYFCKEMIESSADLIARCLYWRIAMRGVPRKTFARIIGRLARWEVNLRARAGFINRVVPPTSNRRPIVFTDPREVILYQLKPSDVVVCHDMGPITHPELYAAGVSQIYQMVFAQIREAKPFMLFVSEASRREFIARYGDDYPLMEIVHPPLRMDMKQSGLRPVRGIPEKFLLTVGAIGERKNQYRAIKAFDAAGLAKAGYAYVICGGLVEAGAEAVAALAHRTPGVILPGYVDDAELRWLYTNAAGFVLPSLLEGFGLPAAECVHYGLIPLLSRGGALQEVAGEGAIYVDPLDEADIAAGMRLLANLTAEERGHRLHGLSANVNRFSFGRSIETWQAALRTAANAHNKGSRIGALR